MAKGKAILIAAGALLAVGAAAAISAPGDHGQSGGPGDDAGWGRGRFHGHGHESRRPLTQDELNTRTRERFARLDRNGDGVIDAAELEVAFAQRMDRHGKRAHRRGERLLRRFDVNRDRKITKDEFMGVVRARFAELDLNNDGKITDDDLPPRLRGRGLLAGEGGMRHRFGRRLIGVLREADANKDGAVTLEEAVSLAEKRFAQLDKNADGVIDSADRDAFRKEMVDYRIKRFIHHFGADADGKITKDRFFAKAQERFARMDQNGDGTVSRDERRGSRMGRHGGRGRDWQRDDGSPDRDATDAAPAPEHGDAPPKE